MVLPAESKSASMRNGVSRLEYITNPEPLQIGNDFQTRIFKEFLHMFSRESRALARVCTHLQPLQNTIFAANCIWRWAPVCDWKGAREIHGSLPLAATRCLATRRV